MCGKHFRRTTPTAYRLAATATGYRWTVENDEVATAAFRDGTWDMADTATGQVNVTVVPVGAAETPDRVAIVDHRGRMAATFAAEDCVVRDSHGEPLFLVRGDGPTGLHVVDRDGIVLALGSPLPGNRVGIDFLMTPAGQGDRRRILLGLSLALSLMRVTDRRTPRVG